MNKRMLAMMLVVVGVLVAAIPVLAQSVPSSAVPQEVLNLKSLVDLLQTSLLVVVLLVIVWLLWGAYVAEVKVRLELQNKQIEWLQMMIAQGPRMALPLQPEKLGL